MAFHDLSTRRGPRPVAAQSGVTVAVNARAAGTAGSLVIRLAPEVVQRLRWQDGLSMRFQEGTGGDECCLQLTQEGGGPKLDIGADGSGLFRFAASKLERHDAPAQLAQVPVDHMIWNGTLKLTLPTGFAACAYKGRGAEQPDQTSLLSE